MHIYPYNEYLAYKKFLIEMSFDMFSFMNLDGNVRNKKSAIYLSIGLGFFFAESK